MISAGRFGRDDGFVLDSGWDFVALLIRAAEHLQLPGAVTRNCKSFRPTSPSRRECPMRKSLIMVLLTLLMLSGATALLSACNTTAGVGQDISATGNALTRGAEQSKPR
jgi:predicted small secreted protein